MDTIASLLSDAMFDKLIKEHAKFHRGQHVHCKTNQKEAVIINVSYDYNTDEFGYDIQCGSYVYHAIPACLLIAIG